MSANNRRIRRIVVSLLFEHGAMTKEAMAALLAKEKSVRNIPSAHSLSSILCKNTQIIAVGTQYVENAVGAKTKHLVYDVDREIIINKEDIPYTRSPTVMTPSEKRKASKCPECGRVRVLRKNEDICLSCIRKQNSPERKD
tara:strand:+ start:8618 stop:9040 length:423 start_codon:yes stop_codon:yes gene_type:complete